MAKPHANLKGIVICKRRRCAAKLRSGSNSPYCGIHCESVAAAERAAERQARVERREASEAARKALAKLCEGCRWSQLEPRSERGVMCMREVYHLCAQSGKAPLYEAAV